MLLGMLAANIIENILTGQWDIRFDEGTLRVGQNF